MNAALTIVSELCFAWVIIYLVFSLRTARWVSVRHGSRYFHLEFQPHRARGRTESKKAVLLKRMLWSAILAVLLGLGAMVASALL
ncbi:hypothetical protein BUPH_08443 (plasmid) [Paraburkholderia phenoliruptrix BR3459a]|uniref:Uncharacterized protein n=1 Tax=Paraburkholderia phenoliruptrix BR3459a TaxID=1229205 RepID=K0E2U3_9BURK|nr:hypothetical protein BUPH_08443 [Paraburkholderia phenoliruptrix BR3459a]